ncbi:hypothetical protein ACTXOJ_07955 [Glutamicibacter arilaitensis]|uniref:hypothetical protein n=1 Tax=Glutamicibacter arilaitensis TaxID=256701 RepID=UPI003FD6AFD9
MEKNRKLAALGAGALVVGAVAAVLVATNSQPSPAANATGNLEDRIGNVAASDPQTGDKVYIDSEYQVVKDLGEAGKLTVEGEKKPTFEITVSKVQKLKSCTLRGFGDEITPENGTFLLLDVTATLDASASKAVDEELAIMPLDASVFGVSPGQNRNVDYGVSTVASYSCDLENALDVAVGAGNTVKGQVMLDSPYSSGQVVYDPQESGGWTWAY